MVTATTRPHPVSVAPDAKGWIFSTEAPSPPKPLRMDLAKQFSSTNVDEIKFRSKGLRLTSSLLEQLCSSSGFKAQTLMIEIYVVLKLIK